MFSLNVTTLPVGTVPTLAITPPRLTDAPISSHIHLSNAPDLHPLVRGALLSEEHSWQPSPVPTHSAVTIFARLGSHPVWIRTRTSGMFTDIVSASLEELSGDEILRDRFSADNAFPLLALLTFLRTVLGAHRRVPPPPRAAFVIDDPNLRMFSYGHIHFPSLVSFAERHNVHVVLATIPLDMWWISAKVARFARTHGDRLSLAVHGNNHVQGELDRPLSRENDLALMAQALRRTSRFETRYQIPVSRVMIPPHGVYSPNILSALRVIGFDALCAGEPEFRLPPKNRMLHRWFPSTSVDGMPIIHRQWMEQENPAKNFLFDAMLGQPIIPYFHHGDFRDGYERFSDLAATINRLGTVHWQSLTDIARSNFDVQEDGTTMYVRPFSRRIDVPVPEGINHLVVQIEDTCDGRCPTTISTSRQAYSLTVGDAGYETIPIPVEGNTIARIAVRDAFACDAETVAHPPFRFHPIIRRVLTEARDRLTPLVYR
jgi:hypothetical protein